jgi:hypothetical protein
MLALQRAMAKARLEKASLDDEIAKLKAKNDELSQQNGELEADNDEFQCPLHSTALRCASVVRCCGLPPAVVPTSVDRSDSVRTETAITPSAILAGCELTADNTRQRSRFMRTRRKREGTGATVRRNANGTDTGSVVKTRVSDWLQRWPRH